MPFIITGKPTGAGLSSVRTRFSVHEDTQKEVGYEAMEK